MSAGGWRVALGVVVVLLTGCSGCGGSPPADTDFLGADALDEVSGLAGSPGHPGLFWVHNDSGDSARIFAVGAHGPLLGTWRVEGARNIDWEAIAHDRDGHLWIADTGNNDNDRRDLVLYRVPEPRAPLAPGGVVQVDRLIRVRFPEQTAFPPPKAERCFDAEAIFWAPSVVLGQPTLFLLSKHRNGDLSTNLYRVDDLTDGADVTLTRVGRVRIGGDPERFGGMVTDAAMTDDGQVLAVLSYHAVFLFRRAPTSDDYLQNLVARIELDQTVTEQAEAIAWDGDDLIFANEQRRIFHIAHPLLSPPARFPAPRP